MPPSHCPVTSSLTVVPSLCLPPLTPFLLLLLLLLPLFQSSLSLLTSFSLITPLSSSLLCPSLSPKPPRLSPYPLCCLPAAENSGQPYLGPLIKASRVKDRNITQGPDPINERPVVLCVTWYDRPKNKLLYCLLLYALTCLMYLSEAIISSLLSCYMLWGFPSRNDIMTGNIAAPCHWSRCYL